MPTYCYKNAEGKLVEATMTVAEKDEKEFIYHGTRSMFLDDHGLVQRDIVAEQRGVRSCPGNWPLLSDALGVHPDQVNEARVASIKSGCKTEFTSDGRAILTSSRHRAKLARSLGFHDRNGGYSDPTPD